MPVGVSLLWGKGTRGRIIGRDIGETIGTIFMGTWVTYVVEKDENCQLRERECPI
ncbi:hypothetical protein J2736_003638 [Paenibacillus qinlingensis]|uniref:Uncharacterized protein n=1 Tax=Paenibacillus qinlingensis TaxID=1837343 RepID=A0ABU1NY47_9BACL|nr:hypothetical protein [Paenibacillus qinlingensis]